MKHDNPILRRARWMKVLTTYFFKIEHKPEKKMSYANYLFRINQTNAKYSWDKKNMKYILNVLYNNKKVYELERYKNPIERLIQISYEKMNTEETSYQAICKEIKKETELHTILVYFITNKGFNCDFYITNIGKRVSQ